MEGKRTKAPIGIQKELKQELMAPAGSDMNATKEFYRTKIQQFFNDEQYNIDSVADMTTLLFDLQVQRDECFMDELCCLVSFILIATQNTEMNKLQKRKEFFRFIKDKSEIFHALDIRIQVPPSDNLNAAYDLVYQQIESLEDDQRNIFMQIYQLYVNQNSDDQ